MHSANSLARAVAIVLLAGAVLMAAATPSGDVASPEETVTPGSTGERGDHAGHHHASCHGGYRVHLDDRGKPVAPPAASLAADPAAVAATRSALAGGAPSQPLIELTTPNDVGQGVVLDERFHMYSVARVAPDGGVVVDCARGEGATTAAPDGSTPRLEGCAPADTRH
jgi:hypothetical protein